MSDNNQDIGDKYIGTALIWIGIGIGVGLTNGAADQVTFAHVAISFMMVLGGMFASAAMLRNGEMFKAKRQMDHSNDTANLLMQLMTDEERSAIKQRLINNVGNDGELVDTDDAEKETQYHS